MSSVYYQDTRYLRKKDFKTYFEHADGKRSSKYDGSPSHAKHWMRNLHTAVRAFGMEAMATGKSYVLAYRTNVLGHNNAKNAYPTHSMGPNGPPFPPTPAPLESTGVSEGHNQPYVPVLSTQDLSNKPVFDEHMHPHRHGHAQQHVQNAPKAPMVHPDHLQQQQDQVLTSRRETRSAMSAKEHSNKIAIANSGLTKNTSDVPTSLSDVWCESLVPQTASYDKQYGHKMAQAQPKSSQTSDMSHNTDTTTVTTATSATPISSQYGVGDGDNNADMQIPHHRLSSKAQNNVVTKALSRVVESYHDLTSPLATASNMFGVLRNARACNSQEQEG